MPLQRDHGRGLEVRFTNSNPTVGISTEPGTSRKRAWRRFLLRCLRGPDGRSRSSSWLRLPKRDVCSPQRVFSAVPQSRGSDVHASRRSHNRRFAWRFRNVRCSSTERTSRHARDTRVRPRHARAIHGSRRSAGAPACTGWTPSDLHAAMDRQAQRPMGVGAVDGEQ